MLSSTRAIVLKTTKYSENSLIVKLYTEAFGLKTYIVGGIHGKKSKAALFMPLSILEVVANHNEGSKLIRPKEIRISEPLQGIHAQIQKSAILLFLNEVLYKSIKEEEANPDLFSFIHHALLILEYSETSIANFHLGFMLKLTRFLGFYPDGRFSNSKCYFNLQEGNFSSQKTNYSLDENKSQLLDYCLSEAFEKIQNREIRNELTKQVILFYELHISGFGKIKSAEVLHEINA